MSEERARRFASCLNGGDTRNAAHLLDDRCICYRGDSILEGKDEIIAWYREHWQDARPDVFNVMAGQSVQRLEENEFSITYYDAIRHKGTPFVYKRKQKILFNRFGKIDTIIDREHPEEHERLKRFTEEAGPF